MSVRRVLLLAVVVAAVALPGGTAHAACSPDAAAVACVETGSSPEETYACVLLEGHYGGSTCAIHVPQANGGSAAALCSEYDIPAGTAGSCYIVFVSSAGMASFFSVEAPVAGCTGAFVILSPFGGSDYEIGAC